jgi:hypothetical protein
MAGADEYRRYARNCLNLSRIYRAPSHSALLAEMAEVWSDLARQAEQPGDGAGRDSGSPARWPAGRAHRDQA